jgi:hypothetical protein
VTQPPPTPKPTDAIDFHIRVSFDAEANVWWVERCNVEGMSLEDDDPWALIRRCAKAAPELIEANGQPAPNPEASEIMREALTACRAKFAEYVELHRAKTRGCLSVLERKAVDEKVARNQEMVDLCDEALSSRGEREGG